MHHHAKFIFVSTLVLSCVLSNNVLAKTHTIQPTQKTFIVSSTDFSTQKPVANKQVFNGFGCTGENLSPQISWKKAPKGTKSFALSIYDPDAPTGSGWWHWVVYNLPASTSFIPSGIGSIAQLPVGTVQGLNDFGTHNYGGPCPPKGEQAHRYIVTIKALSVEKLDLPENASPALIGFMTNANSLGKATLTVKYKR